MSWKYFLKWEKFHNVIGFNHVPDPERTHRNHLTHPNPCHQRHQTRPGHSKYFTINSFLLVAAQQFGPTDLNTYKVKPTLPTSSKLGEWLTPTDYVLHLFSPDDKLGYILNTSLSFRLCISCPHASRSILLRQACGCGHIGVRGWCFFPAFSFTTDKLGQVVSIMLM